MRKVSIASAGGYEKLKIIEVPDPEPKSNEVLIDVKGIGVNYADTIVRLGLYASAKVYVGWPITPGFEVSGIVLKVGDEVKNFKPGDQVMGLTRFNGYSTRLCLTEDFVHPLPKGFDLLQAAGFPAAFSTAYHALKQLFILRKGSVVLIHSAAGGVGSAMVQIAKANGLFVIGIVGSAHKIDYIKKMGADLVIDKSAVPRSWDALKRDGYYQKIDAVFDATGSDTVKFGYEFLRPTGKLVVYGRHSLFAKEGGRMPWLKAAYGYLTIKRINPFNLIGDNKGVIGFNLSFLFAERELAQENISGLLALADQGLIHPSETTYIPFEKVAEAHALIESGKSRGKIVLVV